MRKIKIEKILKKVNEISETKSLVDGVKNIIAYLEKNGFSLVYKVEGDDFFILRFEKNDIFIKMRPERVINKINYKDETSIYAVRHCVILPSLKIYQNDKLFFDGSNMKTTSNI